MEHIDVHEESIFSLLKVLRPPAMMWVWNLALVIAGWIGAVAFIGQYRRHQVVQLLYNLASARVLYLGALVVVLIFFAGALIAKRRALAGSALVIAAFLFGHQCYAWLYPHIPARFRIPFTTNTDALQFAVGRLGYGLAVVVPMLVVWLVMFRGRGWPQLQLGIGDLKAQGRVMSRSEALQPWWKGLVGWYGFFCLIFFLIVQGSAGFGPILKGTLWPLLPGVLVAAAANALAEEYIFRGLIQPALIRAGGIAVGLWMQGLMFGLMHWGMSVGILAALPVSLLIGLGSVAWGKSALDTGGMGWTVVAHFMIDVALMSAFFVPRS